MLKQERVSFIIIIGAWAHNKDANKVMTPDDECGSRLVHKHIVGHGYILDTKVGHFLEA
jgi:hypothetical protein